MSSRTKIVEFKHLERLSKIARMYAEGMQQWQIAVALGLTDGQLSADLKYMRDAWKERHKQDYETRVSEELAKIDNLEAFAHQALQRSLLDAQTVQVSEERGVVVRGRVQPPRTRTTTTTAGRTGDARYMDTIRWCIETRLKLIGALKTTPDAPGKPTINFESLFKVEVQSQEQLVEVPTNTLVEVKPPPKQEIPDYIEQKISTVERAALEHTNGTVAPNTIADSNGHTSNNGTTHEELDQ